MNKITPAEDWAKKFFYAHDINVIRCIKEAQKQAIEVVLKEAASKAEIVHNVDSDYLPYIDTDSILNLKSSDELKV